MDPDLCRILKDLRAPHRYAIEHLENRIGELQDIVNLSPRLDADNFVQKYDHNHEVKSFQADVINPLCSRIYDLREKMLLGSAQDEFIAAYQKVKDLNKWVEFGGEKAFEVNQPLRRLLKRGELPEAQHALEHYLQTTLLPAVVLLIRSQSEIDSCLSVLENKPQLTELRRRRSAKVIQAAYKARLERKARAATMIQRRFLGFRFRPGGQLARKTVKRLREAAEEGELDKTVKRMAV